MTEKGEIRMINSMFLFKWEIPNFCLNCEEAKKPIISPGFSAHGQQWKIKFYPKSTTDPEYCSIYLYSVQSSASEISITFLFSILNPENKIIGPTPSRHFRIYNGKEKSNGWGYPQFVKHSILIDKRDQILNDAKLTILCKTSTSLCKITEYEHDESNSEEEKDNFYDYEKYFLNETFSDMQFIVGEEIIPAHKFVLSTKNEVFAAMFTHNMKENLESKVKIENIDSNIFKEMLRYIYTGKVDGIETIVDKLLVVADRYLITGLKGICEDYLLKNISKENIFDYIIVAMKYNLPNLKKKSIKFIVSNSEDILKNI